MKPIDIIESEFKITEKDDNSYIIRCFDFAMGKLNDLALPGIEMYMIPDLAKVEADLVESIPLKHRLNKVYANLFYLSSAFKQFIKREEGKLDDRLRVEMTVDTLDSKGNRKLKPPTEAMVSSAIESDPDLFRIKMKLILIEAVMKRVRGDLDTLFSKMNELEEIRKNLTTNEYRDPEVNRLPCM